MQNGNKKDNNANLVTEIGLLATDLNAIQQYLSHDIGLKVNDVFKGLFGALNLPEDRICTINLEYLPDQSKLEKKFVKF